jgi:hypothetical protein
MGAHGTALQSRNKRTVVMASASVSNRSMHTGQSSFASIFCLCRHWSLSSLLISCAHAMQGGVCSAAHSDFPRGPKRHQGCGGQGTPRGAHAVPARMDHCTNRNHTAHKFNTTGPAHSFLPHLFELRVEHPRVWARLSVFSAPPHENVTLCRVAFCKLHAEVERFGGSGIAEAKDSELEPKGEEGRRWGRGEGQGRGGERQGKGKGIQPTGIRSKFKLPSPRFLSRTCLPPGTTPRRLTFIFTNLTPSQPRDFEDHFF